ncbi:MAG TPA: hypothetical protein EYN79_06195 [Planctomycetes bacterium]|nr:hypothetical protein [Planctomycetota bacterium]
MMESKLGSLSQQYFEEFGFETVAGDPWAERPDLVLFSGDPLDMASRVLAIWLGGVEKRVVVPGKIPTIETSK